MAIKGDSKKHINRVMIDASKDSFYGDVYDVLDRVSLNFFDPKNNSNKFYIAELHANLSRSQFRFYTNHGRVGAKGAELAKPLASEELARRTFNSKVREKLRKGYVKVDLATYDRGSSVGKSQIDSSKVGGNINVTPVKSSLNSRLIDLVTKIYDEANQAVSVSMTGSVKSDIRAPLGNLGINGIRRGRMLLAELDRAIQMKNSSAISDLSIQYYKFVPRKLPSDLRKDTSWLLTTQNRLNREMEILDLYEDTLKMLPLMGTSDIDKKYLGLNSLIEPVIDAQEMNYLNHKVTSTCASNHPYKLKLVNAYKVRQKNAPPFDASWGNVRKLFHGSRSANIVGILSSYLKLPNTLPSSVHITGAMFGPGLYFAHNSTKSANYSFGMWAGRKNKYNSAYLFIYSVALGRVAEFDDAQPNLRQPPMGYHSVRGKKGLHLYNDEFIVYNPIQVCMEYLLEVEKC